ncbi:MAG: HepT-like ribonuclease domain-containing protein [Campylobacterota bacterium]|nr:HepT-like ribonuclease domain-containing protein [Campylobacterota bacterium]
MSRKEQRDIELFIVDIFIAIEKIKEYIEPFNNEEDFRHSSLHWDASIRQLEIIGEALNNLLNNEYFNSLSPAYFRNVISHGYFGIDLDEVWNVICVKLEILNNDLLSLVKSKIDLSYAIDTELNEYTKLNDKNITKFLIKMRKDLNAK